MKLIDDERLTEYKFKSAFERMDLSLDYMAGWNDAIDKIGTDLEEESVDVTPVVHGHWEYNEELDMFQCSKCGLLAVRNDYPYCHWCGTKMDEEIKES